jgi:glycosyltransferase involved in cell wall biosynthesis
MKILIVTQIYLPEMGALSNRLYPIVKRLAAEGHEVLIATGMPNYPTGKVFPGYRGRLAVTEKRKDCTIFRTAYFTVPRNRSKISQLLSYLSFIPAVFISALRAGKVETVIVTSPPIFPIIPATIVAKLWRAKLVSDVRDIWSDELVAFGEVPEKSPAVRIARGLERWSYRQSDLVTCTTRSLIATVTDRGAGCSNTVYLPNGADLDLFRPLPADNVIANEYPFGDRFVVTYSGLFGIKHGLEVLLNAARILSEHKDIVFFLVGNGAGRDGVERFVKEKSLDNVIIAKERDINDVPYIIARADVCFAAYRPEPYSKKLLSVKLFEYMACEKPVVGAFDGESATLIEDSGCGIAVEPGDANAVSNAIVELYENPSRRERMGKAGRAYVQEHFSRGEWANRFALMIRQIQDNKRNADVFQRDDGVRIPE